MLNIDAQIGADANADTQQGFLSLFGKLNASIDNLAAQVARNNQLEQNKLAHVPNSITLADIIQPGAATTFIKDFGGPQPGREWVVRGLAAIAAPLAANASVITWYVGQNMIGPAAGQLPATMAFWQFSSVPGFQAFTSDVVHIKFGEKLIAGFTGVPAVSSIGIQARINDQILYDPDWKG